MISTRSLGGAQAANLWTAPRRLCLNAEGQVVEADDPTRVSLLVARGGQLSRAEARRLGLVTDEATDEPAADQEPASGEQAATDEPEADEQPASGEQPEAQVQAQAEGAADASAPKKRGRPANKNTAAAPAATAPATTETATQ